MIDFETLRAAVDAVAPGRATPRIEGARVGVVLDATGLDAGAREMLEAGVRAAAAAVPGVAEVRIAVTAERVRRKIVAVASGKGGVGKSTVAANLAIALARAGHRTGLVDADIYGPSQPRLMATAERPQARDKVLLPVATPYGVPMLSMGMLVAGGRALAWRGPMAAGALGQLIEADWGAVELLVVDLPPGTGDVQLTMIQKYKPAGAVIVSTPQDLALIENMAGYVCPHCGEVSDPFGRGGAEAEAARIGAPFLGRIPLDIAIRTASDAGEPPAARDDDRTWGPIAAAVARGLDAL